MNKITEQTTKEEVREVYKNYPDTAPNGFQPFHSSRIDPIYWDIPDNVSILDIGCNSGEFMKRLLAGKKGVTVKGIDLSETAVKVAQDKGLDVILGDGETLPFPDASFDYVVLMEVLVHTHDAKKLLSEVRRVLKTDGVLVGSSPLKDLELHIWDDQRLHRTYYTTAELHALLKETFFDVHLKILKGGQFSINMAGSTVGNLDVEALFKCGGKDMKPWDWKLQDGDTLRAWMGPTLNPGVAYFRMTGFAEKMNKMDRCDVLYHGFDYANQNGPAEWQDAFQRREDNRPTNRIVVDQLDGLLKIADLSIWQITPHWSVLAFFECLKDVRKKPFITEMDDWLFDMPSFNIASHPYRPNSEYERIAYRQIQLSDAVICSTRFIKENIEAMFPGKPVYVVPNAIDFDVWDAVTPNPTVKKEPGRIRIGYTGCGNHGGDIELMRDAVLAILDDYPQAEFITSGAMRPGRDGDPVVIKHDRSYVLNTWAAINIWPQVCKGWGIDIGIAPLWDFNFNRAKSNLRWLEYSAMKVPSVCSKVRPFEESIDQGKTGFLCGSKSQWYETLASLIESETKRKQIGEAAYAKVKRDFNLNDVAKTYKSILEVIKRESRANLG
jgi:SAM-dependent methyltransferase